MSTGQNTQVPDSSLTLAVGAEGPLLFDDVISWLAGNGYFREPIVVDRGEFSVRGGIIDVFPANQTNPLRVVYDGDVVESIRSFEVATQRSISDVAATEIFPFDQKDLFMERSNPEEVAFPVLLSEYKQGEYVVHVDHGIALFCGLKRMKVGKYEGEYLHLQYAGQDKIFVPLEQIRRIHRYSGGGHAPVLNTLGDNSWRKEKAKAKKVTQDIALELLTLYKVRQHKRGHAFAEDSVWQIEVERSFPYKETPDQLKAIEAVKRDMEKARPMDRLICADVGYGKTEVALRAAFKAVSDRKQVALVAPTTLLTQQHFHTFTSRFAPFKYRIELLNRFRTIKEQKQVLKGMAEGTVDVVIGTHRLLQKDVAFHDLGMVIIDEEHRFGVRDKEQLKKLRETVDVLTLTATPIPRTLYLSLAGAKDISVLETPPRDRHPIKTIVGEYTQSLVSEALQHEIERAGQAYFLYNDVRSIGAFTHKLQKLLPEVRIGIAHGQMKKHDLEHVMLKFLERELDVLVCSTIIESGLDIPNANTLLVYDADLFGLAQLHQLRGRVGRSDRQAYAYLFYRKDKVLTQDAYDRLHSLKEFTALGSGYKIAMRDLEIRGAGNILGAEQSGFIATIGFELFCKLLDDSVRESRGERPLAELKVSLNAHAEQYIPEEYIPDMRQRLALYQRIMGASSETEIDELSRELEDRFGPMPRPTENMLLEVRKQLC